MANQNNRQGNQGNPEGGDMMDKMQKGFKNMFDAMKDEREGDGKQQNESNNSNQ